MAAAVPAPEPRPPPPASWFQALLSNHVAVLALGGALGSAALPVWNEVVAWRKGVAANQLQLAAQQERVWSRNLACISHASQWEVDGPENLVVKVTICPSGDSLLRYYQGDWSPQFVWVERPKPRKP